MNGTQAAPAGDCPAAVIRPVRPADLAMLSDFFAGLSAQTRYLRFFAPVTPSPALLRILSGGAGTAVDALVAVVGGGIVGHAMAADRAAAQGAQRTDIGVVVSDVWQGHGVGAALMRTLIARAQARGVTSVTMDVLPGNRRVLAMITGHWPAVRIDHARDSDIIYLRFPPRQLQQPSATGEARCPLRERGRYRFGSVNRSQPGFVLGRRDRPAGLRAARHRNTPVRFRAQTRKADRKRITARPIQP